MRSILASPWVAIITATWGWFSFSHSTRSRPSIRPGKDILVKTNAISGWRMILLMAPDAPSTGNTVNPCSSKCLERICRVSASSSTTKTACAIPAHPHVGLYRNQHDGYLQTGLIKQS